MTYCIKYYVYYAMEMCSNNINGYIGTDNW